MSRKADALNRLERVARLKSDIEMRRFSAFRAHLVAARERVFSLEGELEVIYASDDPFSLTGAQLTNAFACEKARALLIAEQEVTRMLPGFDAARQRALREFGRAEALRNMQKASAEAESQAHMRKLNEVEWNCSNTPLQAEGVESDRL